MVPSPIGPLTLVVADDGHLVGLYTEGHPRYPSPEGLGPRVPGALPAAVDQLAEYFAGERTAFDLPLRPVGDAFSTRVWKLVRAIAHGRTRSYGDLARELGEPRLAQAVGAANARNPLLVVVPCHRVVGADGALVGYAGGLHRKRYLLDLEQPAGPETGRLW